MPAIPVVIKEQVIVKEKRTRNKGQGAAANKDKSPPPREKPKVPDVPTKCPMCGKTYPMQRTYFPQVGSSTYAGNYSYTAVCMDCIEKFFNDHMEMYSGDMQKAVRRTCEWIDAYYDPKIMDRILPEKQGMEEYLHRIRMSVSSINKSFDDTLQDEGDRVYSGGGNVVTLADAGLSTDDLSRAVNIFGEGFEEKAYGYMYRIYRGYIDPLGDTATAGQLKSARFLAALEYRCMEAIKNDKPNASALSSALRKSIAESGFDSVVNPKDDNDVPPIGVLLGYIEKYTPAQYVKNTPYKDVDKQGTYYDRFVRRPTMNLLNRASQKVDDELSITDEEAAAFDSIGGDDDG